MNQKRKQLLIGRALERGMNLIEIMIVLAIITMIAGGVAMVAIPKMREAQVKAATNGARVIRSAVSQWQLAENDYATGPTVSQLVQDKQLDAGQESNDPWGQPFEITCGDDEVTVASTGPDKQAGNADDIVIPKAAVESEE
jgi:general secretion pathway protein G